MNTERHKHFQLLYNTMRDIYDFNHIDQTLSKETVVILKKLYAHYHKKHEKLYRYYQRRNLICNLSAGKSIISAAVAGGITLNPIVIATLTGVGLILKAVASLKKYDKKTDQANFARIDYQKILDEIRFYLRGEALMKRSFLIDYWATDHCMEIPPSICKKYEETFAPL